MTTFSEVFEYDGDDSQEQLVLDDLILSVQVSLQQEMQQRGVSHSELAAKMGVTPARVSQILSSAGSNLTLRVIARIAAALGANFEFVPRAQVQQKLSVYADTIVSDQGQNVVSSKAKIKWRDNTANVNRYPFSHEVAA